MAANVLVPLLLLAMILPASAQTSDPPATVILGTATPGGGFPVYGAAFVETVREFDPTLMVEPRNTKGSTENIPLLEAGAIDIGLVQGEPAYEALSGSGGRPPSSLKVLAAMYSTPGMFVVRADSPVRTIEDLRGKRVALGAKGSGLTILGRLVLEALGLDPDRDVEPVYLDRAGDGPAMVLDGRVAALWGGGIGWPGFTALAASPGGARFVPPSEDGIARILARHPTMRRLTVPAGIYRGQDAPIASVGSWSLVLVRPGLDELVAFRLARALDQGQAAIARRLPQASETTPANTVAAVPAGWLHPGVARYLAGAGHGPR
ncbi:TAXI family TRAP transporter solute-binding subunit [uncultured Enterovirga sp.]|uniref:TAXI family TRAP transporter solute-binding subunit n=1 Tax=uncultured Enterovirga sp. TaxID=2026352 RepID=UPI0035CC1957